MPEMSGDESVRQDVLAAFAWALGSRDQETIGSFGTTFDHIFLLAWRTWSINQKPSDLPEALPRYDPYTSGQTPSDMMLNASARRAHGAVNQRGQIIKPNTNWTFGEKLDSLIELNPYLKSSAVWLALADEYLIELKNSKKDKK